MALKTCPFCGNTEDDGKVYRLAIYMKDQRVATFNPSEELTQVAKAAGQSVYGYINSIVKKTPNSYLMQEVLDGDGKLISSQRVGESLLITDSTGKLIKREIVEGKVPKGISRR